MNRFQSLVRRLFKHLAATAFMAMLVLGPATQPARADDVIQSHATNILGITAEVIQCTRKGDRLTIAIRLRNTSNYILQISDVGFSNFYLTAGDKKYLILNGAGTMSPATGTHTLLIGDAMNWQAKYPAPPADIKNVTFHMGGIAPPFENLPITD
jgi:hypothetical protein